MISGADLTLAWRAYVRELKSFSHSAWGSYLYWFMFLLVFPVSMLLCFHFHIAIKPHTRLYALSWTMKVCILVENTAFPLSVCYPSPFFPSRQYVSWPLGMHEDNHKLGRVVSWWKQCSYTMRNSWSRNVFETGCGIKIIDVPIINPRIFQQSK